VFCPINECLSFKGLNSSGLPALPTEGRRQAGTIFIISFLPALPQFFSKLLFHHNKSNIELLHSSASVGISYFYNYVIPTDWKQIRINSGGV
jgi:hypothetical protein